MISFKKYQQSIVDSRLLKNRHPTQIATSLTLATPSSFYEKKVKTGESTRFFEIKPEENRKQFSGRPVNNTDSYFSENYCNSHEK